MHGVGGNQLEGRSATPDVNATFHVHHGHSDKFTAQVGTQTLAVLKMAMDSAEVNCMNVMRSLKQQTFGCSPGTSR